MTIYLYGFLHYIKLEWDERMDDILLLLSILITGFSLLLFFVSMISYLKLRVSKFILIGIAFLGFTIKGILLLFEFISQGQIPLILDLFVIILIYFAIIKK